MDTAQWPQEIGLVKPMEGMTCSRPASMERRTRPQKEQALNCPRCNSTNTKFCYYNNYSLTQPRYFCKTCRRYWTEGGSLRNVPVGGGSRKNKRSSSNSSSNSASSALANSSKKMPDLITQPNSSQNPKIHQAQDLNLAFQASQEYQHMSDQFVELPGIENSSNPNSSIAITSSAASLSALELLRSGMASRGMNSFLPMPVSETSAGYPAGYGMHELRPSLNFSLDGFGGPYGSHVQGGGQEASGRLLFPFEDLKPVSNTDFEQQNRGGHGDSSGYWNGMLGGGSW